MTDENMRRASLDDILRMKEAGELFFDPNAPEGEDLGPEFWANAVVHGPRLSRSVHLKLDAGVFEYFHEITGGKGHLTRMQAVLKAYMLAHQGKSGPRAD